MNKNDLMLCMQGISAILQWLLIIAFAALVWSIPISIIVVIVKLIVGVLT